MISSGFDSPWKIWTALARFAVLPAARLLFYLNGVAWGRGWKLYGLPLIQKHRHSTMSFGAGLSLRSFTYSNPLGINHPVILSTYKKGAVLEVGMNFAMSGGAICAAEKIIIGNNVAIGANSTLVDTDFHSVDPAVRHIMPQDGLSKPVVIEDDVFIGMSCLVLKGVTIGKGSVIGAGSIVTRDIPPGVIAAGMPAVPIKDIAPPRMEPVAV